jgi:hypothetical protein
MNIVIGGRFVAAGFYQKIKKLRWMVAEHSR